MGTIGLSADYFPFDERPFRLRMGLRSLDLSAWLEVDELFDTQIALRRQLIAERPHDVIGVIDDVRVADAQEELWELVAAVSPSPWRRDDLAPIARCAGSTQEDWVLMVDLGDGPVLGAAGVCFPSRWVLADKLGRTNRAIHAPIAHYDEQLAAPVDQLFERISVDRPVWRLNWNLFDDPELFQPVRKGATRQTASSGQPSGDPMGDPLVWLRVERQTLRRLPRSNAVAFGIRVHQRPVAALANDPDRLRVLAAAIRALPQDTFEYKSLGVIGDDLLGWIDRQL